MILTLVIAANLTANPASIPVDASSNDTAVFLPLQGGDIEQRSAVESMLLVAVDRLVSWSVITTTDIDAMLNVEGIKDRLGCDDVRCASEIGGALGARYILSCSLSAVGDELGLSGTVFDVRSRRAVGRGFARLQRNAANWELSIALLARQLLGLSDLQRSAATFEKTRATPVSVAPGLPPGIDAIDIDVEELVDEALQLQDAWFVPPVRHAIAWCEAESAAARAGSDVHLSESMTACSRGPAVVQQWKEHNRLLEEREQEMRSQYEIARRYVLLEKRTKEQKLAVVGAFLQAYGAIQSPRVRSMQAVTAGLAEGVGTPPVRNDCVVSIECSKPLNRCIDFDWACMSCRESTACEKRGKCRTWTFEPREHSSSRTREPQPPHGIEVNCSVTDEIDCLRSQECTRDGKCGRERGEYIYECVSCEDSRECALEGRCLLVNGSANA